MPPKIVFIDKAWQELIGLSEKAYHNEGCGLLVGKLSDQTGDRKLVRQIVALENMLLREGRGRFDFSFSPEEFMKQQMAVEKAGDDIVGIYHSHPDHPARPSVTDASQPMLAGWINVIAGVHGGRFKEARAWWREDDQTPFAETELSVDKGS